MPAKRLRVPRDESAFDIWLTNFNNNFPSVAAALNESASVARIAQDAVAGRYLITRNEAIRSYKQQESEFKERAIKGESDGATLTLPSLSLPEPPERLVINEGMWDFANRLVQRIIKADAFTPEIEALLDIGLGDDTDSVAPDNMKPLIKELDAVNGAVKIRASLQGMKAFRVFSQRGANDSFEAVGDSAQAEFFDERQNLVPGQPETRQYKLVFLENNKPVGEYSAIETVVTKP
jgi:hypothetical protein